MSDLKAAEDRLAAALSRLEEAGIPARTMPARDEAEGSEIEALRSERDALKTRVEALERELAELRTLATGELDAALAELDAILAGADDDRSEQAAAEPAAIRGVGE